MTKNRILLTVTLLLGVVATMVGLSVYQHLSTHKNYVFQGTLLEVPRSVSNINLVGPNQTVFNQKNLLNRWTFVFFGFTQCESLCPTTLAKLAKMAKLLQRRKVQPLPEVVMITIDPKRDTLARLNQYTKAFHSDFYGVSGQPSHIKALAHELGVVYEKVVSKQNKEQYTLQHSGVIMLFNPQGNLKAFFTSPYQAENLAADYQWLISE